MFKAAMLLSLSLLGADDLVKRSAEYELELVGKSSIRVKLDARMWLPGGSAVTKVCGADLPLSELRVDGKPVAPVVRDGGVLVSVVGRGEHRVGFTALVAVDPDARPQQIVLQTLRSAVMQLRFRLPSNAVEVSVEPAVRTERKETANELLAHLPCTGSVTVQWQERVAEDRGPTAVYARCRHRVSVGRAAASGKTSVSLDLPKGGLTSTTFLVQPGCSVLKVTGDMVRDWQVTQQRLSVYFRGEQTRSTGLTIGFEVPVGTLPHRLSLPPLSVAGVERESGALSVVSEKGAVATLASLDRMKQSESRRATVQQFTYAAAPASARFNVEEPTRLDVRVHAEINGLIAVGDAADHGTAVIKYSIFGVPVNEVRFALPKGTTLQDVAGPDVVTTTVETQDDLSMATVKLANPRSGEYELVVRYEMLQPETASEFAMPLVTVPGAIGQIGRVGVCSVTSAELVAVKIERAQRMMPRQLPARIQSNAQTPLLFGFKYRARPSIVLGVKRHAPAETADAMVDLVESTTVLTRDGAAVTKQQFVVRNRGRQFLTLEYPQDVSIWSVFVAGKPVKPGQAGPRQTLIPLIRSAREGNQLMPVSAEVVWATRAAPLGSRGKTKLALPQVDANVSATQWGVYTPSAFKFDVKESNVEKFEPTQTAVLLAEGGKEADKPATAFAGGALSIGDFTKEVALAEHVRIDEAKQDFNAVLAEGEKLLAAGRRFEAAEKLAEAEANVAFMEKQTDVSAMHGRLRKLRAETRRRSQGAKRGRTPAGPGLEVAEGGERDAVRRKKSTLFTQGWQALKEERFRDAYEMAGKILKLDPQDQSAKILRDRASEQKHARGLRRAKDRFAKEHKKHTEQTYERALPIADFVTYPKKDRGDVWEDIISKRHQVEAAPKATRRAAGDPGCAVQTVWMQETREKLREKVSLDFADTPLTDVIAFLHDVSGINMVLDPEAAGEERSHITLKVKDMSLTNALDVIVRRFAELDWAIRDDHIFISEEKKLFEPELRTYDVRDLLAGAGGLRGVGSMARRATDLVNSITTAVAPASWQYGFVAGGDEEGGTEVELAGEAEDAQGGIVLREGDLVVYQTPDVHNQVSKLLSSLRESLPAAPTDTGAGREAASVREELARTREELEVARSTLQSLEHRGIEMSPRTAKSVTGQVIKTDGSVVAINRGRKDGVLVGSTFTVYSLDRGGYVGRIRVKQVEKDLAYGSPLKQYTVQDIRIGDTVSNKINGGEPSSTPEAEDRWFRTASAPSPPPSAGSEPTPVSPVHRRYASRAGLLAPPIDLAVDGDFHYFRRAYPGSSKEPPFVEFKYRKRSGSP